MSELMQQGQQLEQGLPEQRSAETVGRVTLLQELAEPVEFMSPDRSNRSTPPMNTDFDDQ